MYQIAPIFAEETETSKKANVSRGSSGVLDQCRRRHRKTTNSFGISRVSVSAIIKRVLYAITTFSGPEPIKLRTTENKVKELKNKLGPHEFPQCIKIIDDTHVELNITRIISKERIIFPSTFKLCATKNTALKTQ